MAEAPSPVSPQDIMGALLDIEAGIYAIAAIADRGWERLIDADRARAGIAPFAGSDLGKLGGIHLVSD
jgi:hypothetical protein